MVIHIIVTFLFTIHLNVTLHVKGFEPKPIERG